MLINLYLISHLLVCKLSFVDINFVLFLFKAYKHELPLKDTHCEFQTHIYYFCDDYLIVLLNFSLI